MSALTQRQYAEEFRYRVEERLGILYEANEVTPEQRAEVEKSVTLKIQQLKPKTK